MTPEMMEFLRSTTLFAHAPKGALQQVAKMSTEVRHAAGHEVVREGTGAHFVHVIVSGEANVTAGGTHIATLGPGDHFGEIALLDHGMRTATVTAITDLHALAIDARSFRKLIQSDPELAAALPQSIADRLRELDEKRPH